MTINKTLTYKGLEILPQTALDLEGPGLSPFTHVRVVSYHFLLFAVSVPDLEAPLLPLRFVRGQLRNWMTFFLRMAREY